MSLSVCVVSLVMSASVAGVVPRIDTPAELKKMGFLIGKWKGEGEMPSPDGKSVKFQDEYEYEWNATKTFINVKYKLSVGGMVAWTDSTVLGWDEDAKTLVSFVFGMDGSIGRGTTQAPKDGVWETTGKSSGPTPYKDWKAVFSKKSDDEFTMELFVKQGDKLQPMMKIKYVRAK